MKDALERIAFLPFGKLVDQWRWDVFREDQPADYNKAWWAAPQVPGRRLGHPAHRGGLRPRRQYHVPASVPYTRYFLARILQFQFHRSMYPGRGLGARCTSAPSTATRPPARS